MGKINKKDLTDLIEREEALEVRNEVTLTALYATIEGPYQYGGFEVSIKGEIRPRNGMELDKGLRLKAILYDLQGRLVFDHTIYLKKSDFYGLETFDAEFRVDSADIGKIRLYPKRLN